MNRFYVMGTTCAGKDHLVDHLEATYPDVGSVRVGKIMRERYPPDYFKGMGAPAHTEAEALQIFEEELAKNKDKDNVFIIGQPRRLSQVKLTIGKYPGHVIWLWAPDEVIEERINVRFPNDPASRQLALDRIKNDKLQLYEVLFALITDNYTITAFDTSVWTVEKLAEEISRVTR